MSSTPSTEGNNHAVHDNQETTTSHPKPESPPPVSTMSSTIRMAGYSTSDAVVPPLSPRSPTALRSGTRTSFEYREETTLTPRMRGVSMSRNAARDRKHRSSSPYKRQNSPRPAMNPVPAAVAATEPADEVNAPVTDGSLTDLIADLLGEAAQSPAVTGDTAYRSTKTMDTTPMDIDQDPAWDELAKIAMGDNPLRAASSLPNTHTPARSTHDWLTSGRILEIVMQRKLQTGASYTPPPGDYQDVIHPSTAQTQTQTHTQTHTEPHTHTQIQQQEYGIYTQSSPANAVANSSQMNMSVPDAGVLSSMSVDSGVAPSPEAHSSIEDTSTGIESNTQTDTSIPDENNATSITTSSIDINGSLGANADAVSVNDSADALTTKAAHSSGALGDTSGIELAGPVVTNEASTSRLGATSTVDSLSYNTIPPVDTQGVRMEVQHTASRVPVAEGVQKGL